MNQLINLDLEKNKNTIKSLSQRYKKSKNCKKKKKL